MHFIHVLEIISYFIVLQNYTKNFFLFSYFLYFNFILWKLKIYHSSFNNFITFLALSKLKSSHKQQNLTKYCWLKKKMIQFWSFFISKRKKVSLHGVSPEVKIIRRKLHADFRGRLPIRLAFYDFANPRLGWEK